MRLGEIRAHPIRHGSGAVLCPERDQNLRSLSKQAIARHFRRYGFVLFKDFNASGESFEALARGFSTGFFIDPNRDQAPKLSNIVRSITKGQAAEDLHSELASSAYRPEIIWFYCVSAAREGGETRICDGVKVWEKLGRQTKLFLSTNRVTFSNRDLLIPASDADKWVRRKTQGVASLIHHRNSDGSLRVSFAVSPIQTSLGGEISFANSIINCRSFERCSARLEDGSPLPRAIWKEAVETAHGCEIRLKLKPREFLMIDNLRCMHGRTPFSKKEKRIIYCIVTKRLKSNYRLKKQECVVSG